MNAVVGNGCIRYDRIAMDRNRRPHSQAYGLSCNLPETSTCINQSRDLARKWVSGVMRGGKQKLFRCKGPNLSSKAYGQQIWNVHRYGWTFARLSHATGTAIKTNYHMYSKVQLYCANDITILTHENVCSLPACFVMDRSHVLEHRRRN